MSDGGDSVDLRPPSDNLVDLHISVVPLEHWVERLNYASHKIIGDTFSAGFIRVLPETSVTRLRYDIKEQLGKDIFPKDYVFLKHVGRCLALVRQSQERQLKVKNFLPPHSIMPEIFVLPGQPNMYTYTVLPPIKPRLQDLHHQSFSDNESSPTNPKTGGSTNYYLPNMQSQKVSNPDSLSASYNNSPKMPHDKQVGQRQPRDTMKPGRESIGGASKPNQASKSPVKSHIISPRSNRDVKRQRRHVSGKSSYDNELNQSNNSNPLRQGQRGRTTPGQAFDDPQTRLSDFNAEVKPSSASESQTVQEARQPSHAKSVLREGPKKRRVRYNMPPQSNASSQDSDEHTGLLTSHASHLPTGQQHGPPDSPGTDSSRNSNPAAYAGQHDQASYDYGNHRPYRRDYPVNYNGAGRIRKQFVDTSSHVFTNSQPRSSWRGYDDDNGLPRTPNHSDLSRTHIHANPVETMHVSQQFVPENVNFASGDPQSNPFYQPDTKPGSLVDPHTGTKGRSTTTTPAIKEKPQSNNSTEDSGYVENHHSDSDAYNDLQETRRRSIPNEDEVQTPQEEEEYTTTPANVPDHHAVRNDKHAHLPSPSPIRIPQFTKPAVERHDILPSNTPSPKPAETVATRGTAQITTVQQVGENGKRLGSSDRAKLWKELQKVRTDRRKTEKDRQELVKQAKVTTSRMNQKRTSVRDMWKKKFFEEKKRTLPLEEICRRLQGEVDTSHKRLVSVLEGTKPADFKRYSHINLPPPIHVASTKNNNRIQATRLQHDMDNLRRQIEDAKIKLTGEIKLRHQAEQDVKTVRQELLAKKIRAHLVYREVRGHLFSMKINSKA